MDADKTGINRAVGYLVHELAVDEGLDHAVAADGFGLVPFADGVFLGRPLHGNGGVFIHAAMFFRLGAFHQKQITLPVVFALDLNAHGPDVVGQLHVDEHAGVVGLGRDFDEAPDDGEKIIAVNLGGAEVADGFAGAMDDAVGHAPGLQRVGIVLHAKGPAGEILAVEQLDFVFRRMRGRGSGSAVLGQAGFRQGKHEAKEDDDGFHDGKFNCEGATAQWILGADQILATD